jgi:hypothetical protein
VSVPHDIPFALLRHDGKLRTSIRAYGDGV